MSCPRCEDAQEVVARKYYLRIGNGNVETRCCEAHFLILQAAWKQFQRSLNDAIIKQGPDPELPEPHSVLDHPNEGIGL